MTTRVRINNLTFFFKPRLTIFKKKSSSDNTLLKIILTEVYNVSLLPSSNARYRVEPIQRARNDENGATVTA